MARSACLQPSRTGRSCLGGERYPPYWRRRPRSYLRGSVQSVFREGNCRSLVCRGGNQCMEPSDGLLANAAQCRCRQEIGRISSRRRPFSRKARGMEKTHTVLPQESVIPTLSPKTRARTWGTASPRRRVPKTMRVPHASRTLRWWVPSLPNCVGITVTPGAPASRLSKPVISPLPIPPNPQPPPPPRPRISIYHTVSSPLFARQERVTPFTRRRCKECTYGVVFQ